jgi:6-phosphogluconolactonase
MSEHDNVSTPAKTPTVGPRARSEVRIFAEERSLASAAADLVIAAAAAAIGESGRFLLALAGGSTPTPLYELLATGAYARRVDWSKVEIFWGDERCEAPDHPASNFRSARERLLDRVPVAAANVHRIRGEVDPHEAAAWYERELRAAFDTPDGPPRSDRGARFDLVLLGLGADGHTASLFPETAAVREAERWVVAHQVSAVPRWRITLTPVVLNASAQVLFLVSGRDKAPALRSVLQGPDRPDLLPAQAIMPRSGNLRWWVDAGAASDLAVDERGAVRPPE